MFWRPPNLGNVVKSGRYPERLALVDLSQPGDPRRHSFGELDARANACARALKGRRLTRGASIGIVAANSAEYLVAYLGTLRAGYVAVPVNHKQPEQIVQYILNDSDVALVFADRQRRRLCSADLEVIGIDPDPFEDFLEPGAFESVVPTEKEPGLILYTSGSTGRPKGVVLSHSSQWAIVQGMSEPSVRDAFTGRRGIVVAPLYHMNALVFSQALLHLRGVTVLMAGFDAEAFISTLSEHRVDILTGVPTMLALMAQQQERLEQADLSSVKLVYVGSAPLSETIVAQCRALFPAAAVLNGYGTTETGAGTFGSHPDGLTRPVLSIGYPRSHAEVRLVGTEDKNCGVLEIRSPTNMNEYRNLPDVTAAKVNDGWINTGDIMRRDENGFFYFVGRNDDMFVCSGENIYPGEVERLLERHQEIVEVCVVPVPDDVRGLMPVAFVVRKSDSLISEDEVKGFVLARAAPHMHPRRVCFLDEMPLAGTNKIDRRALERCARERIEQEKEHRK